MWQPPWAEALKYAAQIYDALDASPTVIDATQWTRMVSPPQLVTK
jgi:hypothetical protein